MKKRLVFLLLSIGYTIGFSLAGCANRRVAEITPYIEKFEKEFTTKYKGGYDFKDLDDEMMGVCYSNLVFTNYPRNMIYIDIKYWKSLSDIGKEQLIFHELIHCRYNIDHIEGKYDDGCSLSIMNPYIGSDECYLKHKEEYLLEIKNAL